MKKGLLILFFILGIILPVSFTNAGTILSQYKYAWSSGVGYINFDNVIVNDATLSGYAWSEKSGWIKFDPTKGGVFNDGYGHLSGFAWGEGLGWIDFSGVTISTTTGKFSGTATGDAVGTINFSCPNYCDVRTDWRPIEIVVPVLPPVSGGGSVSGGSGSYLNLFGNDLHVDSYNSPLVINPLQSGTFKRTINAGLITVDVPANNLVTKTLFYVDELNLDKTNSYLLSVKDNLINKAFYDVYALDENGSFIHSFNHPLKIVLPISEEKVSYKDLRLYWLNETNWKWVNIPDAIFTDGSVTFYVNHLTKFAIFAPVNASSSEEADDNTIVLPVDKKESYNSSEKNRLNNVVASSTGILAVDNTDGISKSNNGVIILLCLIVLLIIILVIRYLKKTHK